MQEPAQSVSELDQYAAELKIHANELERRNKFLQEKLQDSRNKPLEMLAQKLMCTTLRVFGRATPPLPASTTERFFRSAEKRDPCRDDFEVASKAGAFPYTYIMVLEEWEQKRAKLRDDLQELRKRLNNGPKFSLLVLISDPDIENLTAMLSSVEKQSYRKFQLILLNMCCKETVRNQLQDVSDEHKNVTLLSVKTETSTLSAINLAIEAAQCDYVSFVGQEDVLDIDALLLFAKTVTDNPDAKIIYSDEDRILNNGSRFKPHFKPDWNRELLYGFDYISRPVVFEKNLVTAVGGFRAEFLGSEYYDLLLRCIERTGDAQIKHIPKVLYSSRAGSHRGILPKNSDLDAMEAGRHALAEHLLITNGVEIPVETGPMPFSYRVHWPLFTEPFVSIIVPTRDRLELTRKAVESVLHKTAYENFELIIVDNGSVVPETLKWFEEVAIKEAQVRIIRDDRPFNYSALNNNAVEHSSGDFIALLNNDVEILNDNWLCEMVSLAARPTTGCVGAKLYYPDGRIQHAGVRVGFGGVVDHCHLFFPHEAEGYFGSLLLRQNKSAVTGACLVVRRDVYLEVGGLNESDLAVAFNDIDFCLKVQAAGYNNVWTPWSKLTHYESASRGREDTTEKRDRYKGEILFMKTEWDTEDYDDPAYNANLMLDHEDFPCAAPIWQI